VKTITSQAKHLAIADLFNQPYLNNNSDVYVRNTTDIAAYFAHLKTLYLALNNADINLKNFLQQSNTHTFKFPEIDSILYQWDQYIQQNRNLVGVFYLKSIIEKFTDHDVDIIGLIRRENKHLLEDFIRIPQETKQVFRINICLPQAEVIPYFEKIVNEVFVNDAAFSFIERVEISRPRLQPTLINFPTLILYLDLHRIGSSDIENVHILSSLLNTVFKSKHDTLPITHDYADPWNEFVNITQGYKLYKVYLQLLGELDQVYARDQNFAYVLESNEYAFAQQLKALQPVA
jgi:hypothetical protein